MLTYVVAERRRLLGVPTKPRTRPEIRRFSARGLRGRSGLCCKAIPCTRSSERMMTQASLQSSFRDENATRSVHAPTIVAQF